MNPTAVLARFNGLSRNARIALCCAVVGMSLIVAAAGFFLHPARVPLFAQPLHPEQLTEVQDRLAQWNIGFTPAADNVVVDAARRNNILLRLSLAGLPHAHVATTNEALANVGVLTPQAVVDAQTRNGLAGEIEIALRSINGVDEAHVIIAPAKMAEFADQGSSEATASVRLQLHPGAHLSRASIAGIRSFVASSITGLDPAHVTILDDGGIAMNAESAGSEDQNELQTSLQTALDDALGAGVAIVRVHAEYSAAARETRDVRRAPLGPITRDEATETFDGQGRRYQKNDEHDDHGSDTRESVIRVPGGSLTRTSTAVFVDASKNVSLSSVRNLAGATVGYDPKRGDTLTVQAVDFYRPRVQPHDAWFLLYGAIVPLLPTLAMVLGLLLAARVAAPHVGDIVKTYAQRVSIAHRSAAVSGYSPAQVRGVLAHEPPHAAAAIISALPAATAAAVLELYPSHERVAIVHRMQRVHSPLIPDAAELIGRHA